MNVPDLQLPLRRRLSVPPKKERAETGDRAVIVAGGLIVEIRDRSGRRVDDHRRPSSWRR